MLEPGVGIIFTEAETRQIQERWRRERRRAKWKGIREECWAWVMVWGWVIAFMWVNGCSR